ncbi:MAG: YceI family protein [Hyphomonadaceae bacterium]
MRALFFAAAMMAASICASSPQPALAQPEAAAAGAQRFVLDPAHTQAAFSVGRFGYNHVLGRFDTISGEVMLDQANPERSSVTATIQTASISTGNDTRNEHLRGANWFNAAEFPTMEFRSTAVTRTGENTADVTGDMTIRGVTQPVTLHVTLNATGQSPSNGASVAGFSATATLSRTAFGVGTPRPPTTLIPDEVEIRIEALGEAPRG